MIKNKIKLFGNQIPYVGAIEPMHGCNLRWDIGWIELPIYEGNVLDTKSNEIPSLF